MFTAITSLIENADAVNSLNNFFFLFLLCQLKLVLPWLITLKLRRKKQYYLACDYIKIKKKKKNITQHVPTLKLKGKKQYYLARDDQNP